MKVEFDGYIVTNAWYKVDSEHCCSFVINTKDKMLDYYTARTPTTRDYFFPVDFRVEDGYAKFIAESEEDLEYLSRMYFQQWDGDQLWVVFLSDNVLGIE
jgi:hypothetical protein